MNPGRMQQFVSNTALKPIRVSRRLALGSLIVVALLAFEIFNYSTTLFALHDLLGDLKFAGVSWAVILAIAFCGIDFAGIARLFTPEADSRNRAEAWYLFAAWMLAATMNAMLTWWGVSLAILNAQPESISIIDRATILKAAPVFVAILVWLIRVLIIGTFSAQGDRLFAQVGVQPVNQATNYRPVYANSARQAQPNLPLANSQRAAAAGARNLSQGTTSTSTAQARAFHPSQRFAPPVQEATPPVRSVTQPEPAPSRQELSYVPIQIAEASPRANAVRLNEPSTRREGHPQQGKNIDLR